MGVQEGKEPRDSEYRQVYEENFAAVYRYVGARVNGRSNAEEIIQDVFVVAWQRLDTMPSGREATMWLLGVARRLVAGQHRIEARSRRLIGRLEHQRPVPAAGNRSNDPVLDEAIASLRRSDQELLGLVFWDGLSREEAAEVLGCSVNAVYVRLHRLRRRLLERLAQSGETGGSVPPPQDKQGADRDGP